MAAGASFQNAYNQSCKQLLNPMARASLFYAGKEEGVSGPDLSCSFELTHLTN